ncbi:hypothetical protein GCM10023116_43070 [Kistimonas scapharcae]|uniref:Chromosome partition protein Smc n=1 Tax=Kistimonas scapharcae TaxID=1036133 RepID=A0ABP8V6Z3_9GAMM
MTIHSDDRDDLDNLPSLSLSPDEVTERSPASRAGKKKKAVPAEPSTGSAGTGLFLILLGLLLAVGGLGYFQITALQNELQATRSLVAAAEKQLTDVSGVVTETGQTMSQSDQQVKSELKDINFEIRKLWDLANKRNRKDIDALEKQLADNAATLKTLKSSADSALKQAKQYSGTLDKTVSRLSLIERQLTGISADLVANTSSSREELDMLTASVEGLRQEASKALADVKVLKADMKQQVSLTKDASRSMDSYRQQINKRLLQLENAVREVQQGSNEGGLTPTL